MIAVLFEWILGSMVVYAALGAIAAVPLHARGLAAIDHTVPGSGWKFRVLITPGLVAFWPILLKRWLAGHGSEPDRWSGRMTPRCHRKAHGLLIQLLAVLIPLLCGLGLFARGASAPQEVSASVPQDAMVAGGR